MMPEDFRNDMLYHAALSMGKTLLEKGLISQKEYARAKAQLLKKYDPYLGKLLSETLDMPFFDSDEEIKKSTGKTPAEIINADGEAAFRQTESGIIHTLSLKNHCVIATGGGAVLKEENVLNLKANGRIYYVDRPLDLLIATPDRPLSSSKEALAELYNQRKHLYKTAADKTVVNDSDIRAAAEIIRKDFLL